MKEKLFRTGEKIREGLISAGILFSIAFLVAITLPVVGLVSSGGFVVRFVKRHKKNIISLGIVVVLIAGYILGTGFTRLQPNTVKIIQEPIGYLDGKIVYVLTPHVNETPNHAIHWKWPMYPDFEIKSKDLFLRVGAVSFKIPIIEKEVFLNGWQIIIPLKWIGAQWGPMGKTKEVINLEQLNFEHKIALWSKDEETGDPKDRNTIVAVVISGELVVDDWQAFINGYQPDEFNAKLKKECPSAPEFNTIEYWSEKELKPYISSLLRYRYGHLFWDVPYRLDLAKILLENKELNLENNLQLENFLKENYPWVWVIGANPRAEYFSYAFDEIDYYALLTALNCKEYLSQVPGWLSLIETERNNFYRLTKPTLTCEAEALLKEFNQYLQKRGQNLDSYDQETLNLEVERFLESKLEYTDDGKLAFSNLVFYEWIKSVVLSNQAYAETLLNKKIIPFFQNHPGFIDELNVYAWQEAIRAASNSEGQDIDIQVVGQKLVFKLWRHPALWERINESLAEKYGKAYTIEKISLKLEERPLFTEDGQVDKDFFFFYEDLKEKK